MMTVLAATDFSERSEVALARAAAVARASGAALVVAHAVDDDQPLDLVRGQARAAGRHLDGICRDLQAGDGVGARVLVGDPLWALASAAREAGAALLVAGDHRRSPFRDAFGDTTVERMVRMAPCPVLLARTRSADGYRHALIEVESDEARELMAALGALGLAGPRRVTLLSAVDATAAGTLATAGAGRAEIARYREEIAAEVRERLLAAVDAQARPRPEVRVVHADPAPELQQVARDEGCDLIVVSPHARRGVLRRVLGSVSSTLIRHGTVDLLVAPRSGD